MLKQGGEQRRINKRPSSADSNIKDRFGMGKREAPNRQSRPSNSPHFSMAVIVFVIVVCAFFWCVFVVVVVFVFACL